MLVFRSREVVVAPENFLSRLWNLNLSPKRYQEEGEAAHQVLRRRRMYNLSLL
jgi:hypothetical protein